MTTSANLDLQKQEECAIFQRFAKVCPLGIQPDSITQHNAANHHDITCKNDKGETLYFELTEVISPSIARSLSNLSFGDRIEARLSDYPRREEFQSLYSAKQIYLEYYDYFKNESALNASRRPVTNKVILGAAHQLFDLLLAPNARGQRVVHPYLGPNLYLQQILGQAIVQERTEFNPCMFDTGKPFPYEPVDGLLLRSIISKCRKNYSQDRLHLLAYFDFQSTDFHSPWEKRVTRLCARRGAGSNFSNLWLFATVSNVIFYRYPPGEHCYITSPIVG